MTKTQLNLSLSKKEDEKLRKQYKQYVLNTNSVHILSYTQWVKKKKLGLK